MLPPVAELSSDENWAETFPDTKKSKSFFYLSIKKMSASNPSENTANLENLLVGQVIYNIHNHQIK